LSALGNQELLVQANTDAVIRREPASTPVLATGNRAGTGNGNSNGNRATWQGDGNEDGIAVKTEAGNETHAYAHKS